MFALTRKVNESIVIPVHSITIHVTQINDRVTLAFDAPEDVRILRGEVYDPSKPVEPRPKPLKVPAPAGVFVVVYTSIDNLTVSPVAFVNRARAIAVAEQVIGKPVLIGAREPDGLIACATEGQSSVNVYHLPCE